MSVRAAVLIAIAVLCSVAVWFHGEGFLHHLHHLGRALH
jgi:hypothetical protein